VGAVKSQIRYKTEKIKGFHRNILYCRCTK
jgi:hypothetical protein